MKILFMGDDPESVTGFAIVNKYIRNVFKDLEAKYPLDIVYLCTNIKAERDIIFEDGHYKKGYIYAYNNIKTRIEPFLIDFIEWHKPDLIFIHNDLDFTYNLLHGIHSFLDKGILEITKAPIIWLGPFDSLEITELDKFVIDNTIASFPYTKYGKEKLKSTGLFRLGASFPIPIGVKRIEHENRRFLSVSVNRYKKRLDSLVDCFMAYKKNYDPNATLTIKTFKNDYFQELFKLPTDCGVIVLDKYMTDEEMLELYKNHDTYICTTPNEGWGFGMSDASHFGMTIIAPDFPVHYESAGNSMIPIPTIPNLKTFDGSRYLPIVNYSGLPELMNHKKPVSNPIDYWEESTNEFKIALEYIIQKIIT